MLKYRSAPKENNARCWNYDPTGGDSGCVHWDYNNPYPHLSPEELEELRAHNRKLREREQRARPS